ncbi:MAG: class I SAM-dependent methyltransferase [Candidatus Nealsonbacteria bacterium]
MPFQLSLSLCPICEKQEKFKFIRDHQNEDGRFSLYECGNCGIQFWNPFKNPGKEWYEKEYDYAGRNILISGVYKGSHKKFLDKFKVFPKNTRVLDVGCGIGEFLAELEKRGCEVWGVDFNKHHTEIATKKFGLKNIYTIDLGNFVKKKNLPQFDIVTFFGVLEHIDNPLGLVREIKRIIKPDGVIVTNAPSKDNLVTGLSFRDLPPDHLSQWNKEAISKLFQKIDFSISHLEYLGQFLSFKSVATEKFRLRLGMVDKTAKVLNSGSSKNKNSILLLKAIHFLGEIKDFIVGGIPAAFLLVLSWLMRKKGGIIFVILKKA